MSSLAAVRTLVRRLSREAELARNGSNGDASSFRTFFDELPVGLYRTLSSGEIVEANASLAKILRYPSAKHLLGEDATRLYRHPEDRARVQAALARYASGSFELELCRRDGTPCWAELRARAVRDAHGAVSHYEGAVIDVTEVHQLSEALRESEAQHRLLFESTPQPLYVVDVATLRIAASNAAARGGYGYSRSEFLAMTVLDLVAPEEHARFWPAYEDFVAHSVDGAPRHYGIWKHVRKNGSELFAEITAQAITFGGRPAYLLHALNVTERLRAETERDHRARQLKGLAEASIAIDPSLGIAGIASAVREHATRLLGAREVEVLLPDAAESAVAAAATETPGEQIARLAAADDEPLGTIVARGGESGENARSVLDQLARIASAAIHNAHLVDALTDSRTRLAALSRQLVQAQEAEQRRIARELHDQMGQMLTGLNLALEAAFEPDGSLRAGVVEESRRIVRQLMTRVHGLALDLRPPVLDRLGVLPAVLTLLQNFTMRTRIEVDFVHCGLETRFSPEVETAAFRITQEALSNVARHAGTSHADLRMYATDGRLTLEVQDSGRGFDPRAALGDHGAAGLTGMQERAAAIGGTLSIDSVRGRGTRLVAELPLATEGDEQ